MNATEGMRSEDRQALERLPRDLDVEIKKVNHDHGFSLAELDEIKKRAARQGWNHAGGERWARLYQGLADAAAALKDAMIVEWVEAERLVRLIDREG